jgi:hypothetical protein
VETVPLNNPRLLIRLRVCRKSGNCAFKQPETLDTALDSLHRKITHTDILLRYVEVSTSLLTQQTKQIKS